MRRYIEVIRTEIIEVRVSKVVRIQVSLYISSLNTDGNWENWSGTINNIVSCQSQSSQRPELRNFCKGQGVREEYYGEQNANCLNFLSFVYESQARVAQSNYPPVEDDCLSLCVAVWVEMIKHQIRTVKTSIFLFN